MLTTSGIVARVLYSKEYFDFLAADNRLLLKSFIHEIKGALVEAFNDPEPGIVNDSSKINRKDIKFTMTSSAKKDNSSPKTLLLEIEVRETPVRLVNQSVLLQSMIRKGSNIISRMHKDFKTPPFLIEVTLLLVKR